MAFAQFRHQFLRQESAALDVDDVPFLIGGDFSYGFSFSVRRPVSRGGVRRGQTLCVRTFWELMLLKRERRLAHYRRRGSVPDGITPGWPLGRKVQQIGAKLQRRQSSLDKKPRRLIRWLHGCFQAELTGNTRCYSQPLDLHTSMV